MSEVLTRRIRVRHSLNYGLFDHESIVSAWLEENRLGNERFEIAIVNDDSYARVVVEIVEKQAIVCSTWPNK